MTGDGVNDAPALREAHIGVAMGKTGTEVTREAADIVLADDNFATIVAAVREGRGIFDNIRKTLVYLLAGNAAELAVMLSAALLGLPLPLLPLHLLWINLVTDGLPALALVVDPVEPDVLRRPPRCTLAGMRRSRSTRAATARRAPRLPPAPRPPHHRRRARGRDRPRAPRRRPLRPPRRPRPRRRPALLAPPRPGRPPLRALEPAAPAPGSDVADLVSDAAGNAIWSGNAYNAPTDGYFTTKVKPDGTPLWAQLFPREGDAAGVDLAVDPGGRIAHLGIFRGTLDVGAGAMTGPDGSSFVALFRP